MAMRIDHVDRLPSSCHARHAPPALDPSDRRVEQQHIDHVAWDRERKAGHGDRATQVHRRPRKATLISTALIRPVTKSVSGSLDSRTSSAIRYSGLFPSPLMETNRTKRYSESQLSSISPVSHARHQTCSSMRQSTPVKPAPIVTAASAAKTTPPGRSFLLAGRRECRRTIRSTR